MKGLEAAIDLPASSTDSPRVSTQRVWADWWNGMNNVPSEVITSYTHDGDGGCRVTLPDQTVEKVYYGSTWKTGLTTETRSYATVADANANSWKKDTITQWAQDDMSVSYLTNPRVTQTEVWDSDYNHRRTTIAYGPYEQWSLPYLTREFATVNGTEIEFRQHYTDYNLSQQYLDRRIIGLPSAVYLTNVSWFQSKVSYDYDAASQIQATSATTIQHDPSYDTSIPRGNVTSTTRWDTTDQSTINDDSKKLTSLVGYDTNGSPVWSRDAAQHQSNISYTDSFSADGVNNTALSFATFAYPTTLTDADGNSSTMKYHYDFGAVTRTDGPPPAGQYQGASQKMTYDSAGRLSRTDNLNNNAYVRWDYGSWVVTKSETIQDGAGESHTVTILNGFGSAVATGGDNPGSAGGSWAKFMISDLMGRPSQFTNPTEINSGWVPSGDDAAGWIFSTPIIYDWKGRPRYTYNIDNTSKMAEYGGCGCAGGEVVTLTDEMNRKQKSYADPLGRTYKVEVLNDSGGVYSTTVSIYNARDQVTAVNTYKGTATSDLSCPSGTCMQSVTTFDGYGRPASQKQPQQTSPTTYAYNPDDTVHTVTDPRGVVATNTYNGRHQLTGVSYTAPGGISTPSPVSFGYDAVGNRTAMSDGSGTISYGYNQLSRLTSETRTFSFPDFYNHSYTIGYGYNLGGELTSVTDPSGAQVSYNYDSAGKLTSMPASGYTGVTNFLSNLQYRAFGGMKHATYGNSVQVDLSYNARMQIGQYQVSSAQWTHSMGATMSYYWDGRTNTAFDLNDGKFDRKYDFDFSGRLKEAYSGVEAHGQAAPPLNQANSPYRQTYTYDEYSDVLTRSGRMWTQYDAENGSYTNDNKRQGWSYDNAGNALTTFDGTYTYDAASRPVTFTSNQTWKVYPDWPLNPPDGPSLETQDTFDGTGQIAKHVNHTRTDQSVDYGDGNYYYSLGEATTTTYYVHSTALGGKTIAEVGSNGAIGDTFVYSGGAKLATQHHYSYSTAAVIEATNPVTGAAITTDANASYATRQEPDPLGRELSQPPVSGLVSDPVSGVLKDHWMPIEYTGGPSDYYLQGNADWAAVRAQYTAEYQAGLWDDNGNKYFELKNQFINAVINKDFSQAETILANNPNFFISINGTSTAGAAGADALEGALLKLPGVSEALSSQQQPKYRNKADIQIDTITYLPRTYGSNKHGLKIRLLATVTDSRYQDFNWVQIVDSNEDLSGNPVEDKPFLDVDPGQRTPFYWNPEQQTRYEQQAQAEGGSTVFVDNPTRGYFGTI